MASPLKQAYESRKGVTISECGYDALVLDAALRQSLVTVRSLGRHGLRIAALDTKRDVPAFASRWCQGAFVAPSYEKSIEAYLTYLSHLLNRANCAVLIPSSDGTVALIREHRDWFEQRVSLALAKEPALGIATRKDQTLEIAAQLGLNIPTGVTVGSYREVEAALREVGLPAVVKPVESWLWGEQQRFRVACQLVTTLEEAYSAVEELTRYGGSTIVQRYLSGRREAISLFYAQGEIYARFAQWASRTLPPLGGTSVIRQSIAIPTDIGEQAEKLVRTLNLEGYSEVEFRRDSSGKPYLMEINPRLSASVELAVRAGVDFPFLLYQWASGKPIEHIVSYRVGKWMRYLQGDIMTTGQALSQRGRPGVSSPVRTMFDFCTAFFRPMDYDYVDWHDPLPAWAATTEFCGELWHRLGRRLERNKS